MRSYPSARSVGNAKAATHLLVAREALHNAEVELLGAVREEDDPMWEWASRTQELRKSVDALRNSVHGEIWKG